MAAMHFKVGDRVQARTSRFVPAGTPGTIQRVLLSAPGMYYVKFDGIDQPRLMHARDLERADDTSQPDHGDAPATE